MRWGKTIHAGPKVGDTREITAFLVIPKCINGEWRWLEYARWDDIYRKGIDFSPGVSGNGAPLECVFWSPVQWRELP